MEIQHRKELWQLLESFNLKGEIAEVGVAEGNNSELMASWDCVTKLWMIDNWATIEGQKGDASSPQSWHDDNYIKSQNIASKNIKCVIVNGLSIEMAKNIPDDSLIMVYIDADHSYEGVKADLLAWSPKVISGGIIAGHDILSDEYGVKQAVEEFCLGRFEINIIHELSPENASFWFQKKFIYTKNFTS